MKLIPLTQGEFAIVDDEDFERVNQWKWQYNKVNKNGYAMRSVYISKGKYERIYMHRFITNAQVGMDTDHINGDTLDNSRKNLRIVTHAQNIFNQTRLRKDNTSGHRGVAKSKNKWVVLFEVNKKKIHGGRFYDKQEAIKKSKELLKAINTSRYV